MDWDTKSLIERIRAEVIEDALDGTIPSTVRDFSELHDFVDANEYGGLCDDECPFKASSQADTDIINDAQDAISGWLHRGGLLLDLARIQREQPDSLIPHHSIFSTRRGA